MLLGKKGRNPLRDFSIRQSRKPREVCADKCMEWLISRESALCFSRPRYFQFSGSRHDLKQIQRNYSVTSEKKRHCLRGRKRKGFFARFPVFAFTRSHGSPFVVSQYHRERTQKNTEKIKIVKNVL